MKNILTIDLEDWYHPELVRGSVVQCPVSQIEEATRPILDLLDFSGVKATFFVLGEVAERNPGLIESIFEKGHEIASHGFSHKPLWKLDKSLLREEIEHFQSVIEKILGKIRVKGFRAPTFSLDNRTKWALKVLLDYGYQYDSSICPVRLNPLYGVDGAPVQPYRISLEDVRKEDLHSPLLEFPLPLLTIGRLKIPISGGFYLRVFPTPFLRWGLKRINRKGRFFLYLHPWESYGKTPRLNLPLYNYMITYFGNHSVLVKLKFLLKQFRFTRVDGVLGLREKNDEI